MPIEIVTPAQEEVVKYTPPKIGETPLEILELCYQDVPKEWICGSWSCNTAINGRPKPLGCAAQLVAINGGVASYTVTKITDSDRETFGDEILGAIYWVTASIDNQEALYENLATCEAIYCLAMAIPNIVVDHFPDWSIVGHEYQFNGNWAVDAVIKHNDGGIDRGLAAAWFLNSMGIAELRMKRPGKVFTSSSIDDDPQKGPQAELEDLAEEPVEGEYA